MVGGSGRLSEISSENWPLRQSERPQCLVEAPRQRARGALHVQAQAMVAHPMGEFERRRIRV